MHVYYIISLFFVSYMNREILRLVIPNIISNVSVPLLGLIDLAVLGRLDSIIYLDAVAVGSLVFNFVYWNFSFLRMGASGLTAQAYGSGDRSEQLHVIVRGLLIAFLAGAFLVIFRVQIAHLVFRLLGASPDVTAEAINYFRIRIFAAPATIALFAFSGWFIGMQNAVYPMLISIAVNLLNAGMSYYLAITAGMSAQGVALGTVFSQYIGLVLCIIFFVQKFDVSFAETKFSVLFDRSKLLRFFTVNSDIFLRTLCVIGVMSFFTSNSASNSNEILAVNTILLQFFLMYSFFIDGFAYAAESLVGKYYGRDNRRQLLRAVKSLFAIGVGVSIFISAIFCFTGDHVLGLLTDNYSIIHAGAPYLIWVKVIPLVSVFAFLWDGVFIGATATRLMRNSLFFSAGVFFLSFYAFPSTWGNHGLWFSFVLFLLSRGLFQTIVFKKHILLRR